MDKRKEMEELSANVDGLTTCASLETQTEEASSKVNTINTKLKQFQDQVVSFNRHERLFGWSETTFPHLAAVQRTSLRNVDRWAIYSTVSLRD